MGLFSGISKFFKKIFSFIKDIFTAIADALGPLLPILIIALFAFAGPIGGFLIEIGWPAIGGALATVGGYLGALSPWAGLAVGLGVSYLVAPEATGELIGVVGDMIGDIAEAGGEVIGSALSGVLSSPIVLIGVIALGYWFFTKDDAKVVVSERGQK